MTKIMGALAALAVCGCAQPPLWPHAATPAAPPAVGVPHQSAFEGYRAFNAEQPLKDWRGANDEVREAGGHMGLMKGHAHK